MSDKILVNTHPFFSDFFYEASAQIFLLSEAEAKEKWCELIGSASNSYFDLNDKNWLIISPRSNIGVWIEALNNDNMPLVEELLQKSFNWKEDSRILFCANKKSILETTWKGFASNWSLFLLYEDDCPIVLNPLNKKVALIFTPLGSIIKIEVNE